jgi:predicted  nucleic acid-binding Zn ribbon protein
MLAVFSTWFIRRWGWHEVIEHGNATDTRQWLGDSMYVHRIEFSFEGNEAPSMIIDVTNGLLAALRMNGQINGREWPIYFGSGLCSAIVLSPEEDSLNLRNFGEYPRKHLREAEGLGISIASSLIAKDCDSAEPCRCQESSGYVLFTTFLSLESPVRCLDCLLPVPLYRFPVLPSGEYYEIVTWQSDYQSCDRLQMNCSVLERASTRQISDPRSSLSRVGQENCRLLTDLVGKPFYYYLYRGSGRSVRSEKERCCPSCGQSWYVETPLHPSLHYQCDRCKLTSNFAWNLSR